MSQGASQIAFLPLGPSVTIAANSPAPTGVQVPVSGVYTDQGQYRVVNSGTVIVHLGYGPTAAAAQSAAVASTAGSPTNAIPILAGAVEVFRLPAGMFFSAIAASATSVYMTPGQGL